MLEAYLDESGIHDGAKVCMIAGYFGGRSQLRKLEQKWKSVLEDFDFPMKDFHAKELIDSRKYRPMLTELGKAIAEQRKVHPISCGVVPEDFFSLSEKKRRFLTGAKMMLDGEIRGTGCPNKPYFVPFQNIVRAVTDGTPAGGKAHFFFGCDKPFAGYAMDLWQELLVENMEEVEVQKPWNTWHTRDRLGVPSFPLASETAQLQAADLLVHLTYRHMLEWQKTGKVQNPSDLLGLCLRNRRIKEDHVYQDRDSFNDILEQCKEIAPGLEWRE
jgi:hypothetical protein